METIRRAGLVAMVVLGGAVLGCAGSAPPPAAKSAEASPSTPAPGGAPADVGEMQAGSAAPQAEQGPSAAPAPPSATGGSRAEAKKDVAPDSAARPGLGTEWGESRSSRISTVPFVRADSSSPFATASLFYNDEAGAKAMAQASGFRRTSGGMISVASGSVGLGLRDERGNFLSGFVAGERNYSVGEAGSRYTIVIKNRTNARFECVISVDGLDVLDGKAASFAKRGYLVEPGGELEVDGFRQSTDSVAAFRFGSVRGSYANQKHGETRNVGVIGLAIFHERGSNPGLSSDEIQKRHDANPFPGQFATPPGRN